MSALPIDPRIIREAAHWLMRLHESDMDDVERQAWHRWRAQSAEHQRAWERADAFSRKFDGIPAALSMPVLGQPPIRGRRAALKVLSLLIAAGPTAWLASKMPWEDWTSEYRAGTGEQRSVTLADGSSLTLNTATALDVVFSASHRQVTLHSGEVLIEAAPGDGGMGRPFIVRTRDGLIRTRGGRFDVRLRNSRTQVAVLDGTVHILARAVPGPGQTLLAGFQNSFTPVAVDHATVVNDTATLWSQGVLYADNMRLADFLAELSRYRLGTIRCDPSVADMRISGSFQLRDTDRVLQLLVQTFPLRISSVTPYWITVGPLQV